MRALRLRPVDLAVLTLLGLSAGVVAWCRKDPREAERCGQGFVATDPGRCCQPGAALCSNGAPAGARVAIAARRFEFGSSDWEARGEVAARTVQTAAFWLDRHELTRADLDPAAADPARAAAGLSRDEARALCTRRGGRLPSDDEWLAAAAGKRYPWGDTGLVCRRAAWGLVHGPCAQGASGPDTVGAHPDGASSEGVQDLTGNVAEWVETADGRGVVRGGSYADDFAANLRSWAAREVEPTAHDPHVGARCAYDSP